VLQVEIAKNVVLFGLKGCVLHDTEVVTALDLSAQFYLSEASIGANRAEACVAAVAELNPSVAVSARVLPRERDRGALDPAGSLSRRVWTFDRATIRLPLDLKFTGFPPRIVKLAQRSTLKTGIIPIRVLTLEVGPKFGPTP
jgi:hypothetical protein